LAGGYLFRVLGHAMAEPEVPLVPRTLVRRRRQAVVLGLALCSALLGLVPLRPFELLQIGHTAAMTAGFR
jgi:multicomponent Na+:H+ antiporter subunit D